MPASHRIVQIMPATGFAGVFRARKPTSTAALGVIIEPVVAFALLKMSELDKFGDPLDEWDEVKPLFLVEDTLGLASDYCADFVGSLYCVCRTDTTDFDEAVASCKHLQLEILERDGGSAPD